MTRRLAVEWLDAARAANAAPASAPFARVLVCDLRDAALAPLLAIAPHDGDLADARYPGASERSWFLQRRLAARALAARCAGADPSTIRIRYDAEGAPRVEGAGLFVSVSSRGPHAAIAIASQPVGVDLEPFDAGAPVIEDVLEKSERLALSKCAGGERARAFLRIWTAKEAYLKALGRGFKRDPALVRVTGRGEVFAIEDTGFAAPLSAGAYAGAGDMGEDFVVACAVLPS